MKKSPAHGLSPAGKSASKGFLGTLKQVLSRLFKRKKKKPNSIYPLR
ncbi:hypothetical protein [Pseudomonas fluorescens]|uniref:Uncharacterized protein n=1 Tax=Pseudomonas fluorescens TaxID=294 RepID=A0A944HET8_PSEFL|nr:hypothetical protein [Pseudomonas fluorescens]MBT2298082.1 hypothetical protein [Pseudomonas fluorescens]MBT2309795.1 hypothetical protein [Pseudomonas fluorescens]MBT2314958.1 hypothetical protein [Pseudomonas fluorescens]MBT2327864.1 hypothetical protein [Pseudomonas fluorescens]MBT2345611.1 hypothetical protein [Pseudomonas fluorescens]